MDDAPIGLEDTQFTTAEIVEISGVPDKSIRNWLHRGLLEVGEIHFSGRRLYSLVDAIRLTVMQSLTNRVPLKPTDAVDAAELLVRYVLKHAPVDHHGRALLDLRDTPISRAYAIAIVDGKARAGLIDPKQPGGYAEFGSLWAEPHIVVPIIPLVQGVQFRTIGVLAARKTGRSA